MDIEARVIKIVKSCLENNKAVILEHNLEEIGADSIIFIKIIVQLEMEFDIDVEDEKLTYLAFENIRELVKYVKYKKGVAT